MGLSQTASIVNDYFAWANAEVTALRESSNPLEALSGPQPDLAVLAEARPSLTKLNHWALQAYFFALPECTDLQLVSLGDDFWTRAAGGTGSTLSLKKAQEHAHNITEYLRQFDPELQTF